MCKLAGWAFTCWICAIGAPTLQAQEKMVAEEGAVEVMLLMQTSVRDELKLSHKENDKIENYTSQQWVKAKEINKLPEAEHEKHYKVLSRENEYFLDKTLTRDQRHRLKQIELQVTGLMCVTRPEVARKLNLTEDQKKRAAHMQVEARLEIDELLAAAKGGIQTRKFDELRQTSRTKLLELLTDEQEAIWGKMVGIPFAGEFDFGPKRAGAN